MWRSAGGGGGTIEHEQTGTRSRSRSKSVGGQEKAAGANSTAVGDVSGQGSGTAVGSASDVVLEGTGVAVAEAQELFLRPSCPPPVPRCSPLELLEEVKRGTVEYALRKVIAIGAAQELLSKHLEQPADIDRQLSGLSLHRADMQIRCQTEHERLLQLLRDSENVASVVVAHQGNPGGAVLQERECMDRQNCVQTGGAAAAMDLYASVVEVPSPTQSEAEAGTVEEQVHGPAAGGQVLMHTPVFAKKQSKEYLQQPGEGRVLSTHAQEPSQILSVTKDAINTCGGGAAQRSQYTGAHMGKPIKGISWCTYGVLFEAPADPIPERTVGCNSTSSPRQGRRLRCTTYMFTFIVIAHSQHDTTHVSSVCGEESGRACAVSSSVAGGSDVEAPHARDGCSRAVCCAGNLPTRRVTAIVPFSGGGSSRTRLKVQVSRQRVRCHLACGIQQGVDNESQGLMNASLYVGDTRERVQASDLFRLSVSSSASAVSLLPCARVSPALSPRGAPAVCPRAVPWGGRARLSAASCLCRLAPFPSGHPCGFPRAVHWIGRLRPAGRVLSGSPPPPSPLVACLWFPMSCHLGRAWRLLVFGMCLWSLCLGPPAPVPLGACLWVSTGCLLGQLLFLRAWAVLHFRLLVVYSILAYLPTVSRWRKCKWPSDYMTRGTIGSTLRYVVSLHPLRRVGGGILVFDNS